jgi:hypothetical protein
MAVIARPFDLSALSQKVRGLIEGCVRSARAAVR